MRHEKEDKDIKAIHGSPVCSAKFQKRKLHQCFHEKNYLQASSANMTVNKYSGGRIGCVTSKQVTKKP